VNLAWCSLVTDVGSTERVQEAASEFSIGKSSAVRDGETCQVERLQEIIAEMANSAATGEQISDGEFIDVFRVTAIDGQRCDTAVDSTINHPAGSFPCCLADQT
jgi:hypothetical protein